MEGRDLKKSWTQGRTHGHLGDFILCPTICIALNRQKLAYGLLMPWGTFA